ncbi:MAG: hypothetical protein FJX75_07100 [Armatimonadetes bacterium]|nr:hypothetical protein [Armatimonadota bacterium]
MNWLKKLLGGPMLRCNNCGARQREGAWEDAMQARAAAAGSRFVNLSASPECLKCGSTDLVGASSPRPQPKEAPKEVADLAGRFAAAGRKWAAAHSEEQAAVGRSSDGFRAVLARTRPIKEETERLVKTLIGEARARGVLDDVLRLLQRKGEKATLYLMDAYL